MHILCVELILAKLNSVILPNICQFPKLKTLQKFPTVSVTYVLEGRGKGITYSHKWILLGSNMIASCLQV